MFLINELSFSNQLALSARHFILSTQLFFRSTGNFMSEALTLKLVNPPYDDRLLIDCFFFILKYEKKTSSEHVLYKIVLNAKTKTKSYFCTKHVLNLYFSSTELVIR